MIMPNMDPKKCPMPVQDPDVRNKNFKEVALGYTYEMAVNEAKRCLNCKNKPCVSGCPVNIDIPAFIAKVADEDMEGAYAVLARPARCRRCAAACARRRTSARANVFAASKRKAWASAVWSGLWPTGIGSTAPKSPPCPCPTGTGWRSSAPARPG